MTAKQLVAALADKLVAGLEAQRGLGPPSYPLSIKRLVELVDPQAPADLVAKALNAKNFSARAIRTAKKNPAAPVALVEDIGLLAGSPLLLTYVLEQLCTPAKPTTEPAKLKAKVAAALKKPFEDAVAKQIREGTLPPNVGYRLAKNKPQLYLNHIPPPPLPPKKPEEVWGDKLLQALEAQRRLGGDSYPLTLQRLVELADLTPAEDAQKFIGKKPFKDRAFVTEKKRPEALVAFTADFEQLLSSGSFLPPLLRNKRKEKECAFPLDSLLANLPKRMRESAHRQIEAGSLASGVGWMWVGKKRQVFLLADIHSQPESAAPTMPPVSPPASAVDFAQAFDTAFNLIDRQHGAHNFVSLTRLRQALPLSREQFDAELRQLRIAGRYTLSAAEGRDGLSEADRTSGIIEDGSLLLFVSRKSS